MGYGYFDEVLSSQKQLPTLEQDNSKQAKLPVHVLRMLACGAPGEDKIPRLLRFGLCEVALRGRLRRNPHALRVVQDPSR